MNESDKNKLLIISNLKKGEIYAYKKEEVGISKSGELDHEARKLAEEGKISILVTRHNNLMLTYAIGEENVIY